MYRTEIYRAENNKITGRAQYRVRNCWVDLILTRDSNVISGVIPGHCLIKTRKPYRKGNLINPRKALGI